MIMTFIESLIFWAVTGAFSILSGKLLMELRKHQAVQDGVQAILRDRIIQATNHYQEKGYAPLYARENIGHMRDAYHALGGNGVIEEIYKRFVELPQVPPS